MQETKESKTKEVLCICEALHILCKHNLRICTCTFCRARTASRKFIATNNRTTTAQLAAITNLAQVKQRSLPANISTWSIEFASKYIKFLISLPFPREVLPRLEQFNLEHNRGDDAFNATRRVQYGEHWKSNCQDENDKPLQSENEKMQAVLKEGEAHV